jgi:hypothetical protein
MSGALLPSPSPTPKTFFTDGSEAADAAPEKFVTGASPAKQTGFAVWREFWKEDAKRRGAAAVTCRIRDTSSVARILLLAPPRYDVTGRGNRTRAFGGPAWCRDASDHLAISQIPKYPIPGRSCKMNYIKPRRANETTSWTVTTK